MDFLAEYDSPLSCHLDLATVFIGTNHPAKWTSVSGKWQEHSSSQMASLETAGKVQV
jgi:hypothetical protein